MSKCKTCSEIIPLPESIPGPQGPQGIPGTPGQDGTTVISNDNTSSGTANSTFDPLFQYIINSGTIPVNTVLTIEDIFTINGTSDLSKLDLKLNLNTVLPAPIEFSTNTQLIKSKVILTIDSVTSCSLLIELKGYNSLNVENSSYFVYVPFSSILDITSNNLQIDWYGAVNFGELFHKKNIILKHLYSV
jgi:hypothetical protein